MINNTLIHILLSLISVFPEDNLPNDDKTMAHPFVVGEELQFKVKYGWFTIGKAEIKIPSDTTINSEPYYNVSVEARTAGLIGLFNTTIDRFYATIGQNDLKPVTAYKNFLESGEREIQTNHYDYDSGKVVVERVRHKGKIEEPKTYDLDSMAFDILSSYLYLRSLDGMSLEKQDSVMIKVFYGKRYYDFGLEYVGTEFIKTKIGRIHSHKLYLLFPVSSAFPEPKAVKVWVTADSNQLPIKIEAKLKFGRVTCDLVDYSNIRQPINSQ